jgi:transposase
MEATPLINTITLRQAVGIDIANQSFEAALGREKVRSLPQLGKSQSFENVDPGFAQLIQWLVDQGVDPSACLFVMEATGVYYEALANWLYDQGYQVVVLLANTVVAFAKSLNIKTKNDQVDAGVLAHMGCERHLDTWQPPLKEYKELKQLTRLRQSLVHQRSMNKNQIHASKKQVPVSSFVIAAQEELIQIFSDKIKQVEKQIRKLIKAHDKIEKNYEILRSIPGYGPATASVILAETQGFYAFRNQAQLVSYAGYDVIKRQSGSSINHKERISKKGNYRIRKALFFPALVAPRSIPAFKRLYDRILLKNPTIKMKASVALQRKLLVIAFQLCKKQQKYDPKKMI